MNPAATPTTAATAAGPPPVCRIRNWRVFTHGVHKDALYPPAAVRRIADNFARLRGHLTPVAGLGHDRERRVAVSLGLPNVGEVAACRATPDGDLYLDVANVPAWLGGMIAARRYRAGSVELLPKFADPKDPAVRIDGPVLTGVAFLGDEQPAVKGCDPPVATYADGRPVPPNYDPLPVPAEVMASLYSAAAAPGAALCFSETSPPGETTTMTPEQHAALEAAGFTPEQVAAIEAAGLTPEQIDALAGGAAPPAEPAPPPAPPAVPMAADPFADQCKKYAADPAATPDQKMMAALFAESADLKKRVGAFEASAEAGQKKDEEARMAAFSAMVDLDLGGVWDGTALVEPRLARKVKPLHRPAMKDSLIQRFGPGVKTFSSEHDRVKGYRDQIAAYSAALPDDPRLLTPVGPAVPTGAGSDNPVLAAATRKGSVLDRLAPAVAARHRAPAA